jgi:hypothetical protein
MCPLAENLVLLRFLSSSFPLASLCRDPGQFGYCLFQRWQWDLFLWNGWG